MKKIALTALLSLTFVLSACDLSSMMGQTSGTSNSTSQSTSFGGGLDKDSTDKGNSTEDSIGGGASDYLEDETHVDKNRDDACDKCGKSVSVTFDFYTVNDMHGKFEDSDTQPGVDELSTYFQNAKAKNENTILLSSGDMWQGTAESYLTRGNIITEWMNEMDFVAMTLGNHEYDWGEEYIEANAELAEFPFLAINVYDTSTNELVDYCQPSVMIEQNGVKIGIIGAMGDCYSSISADKVEDVYFKTGSALTGAVKSESRKLRQQGADFIIYSIHDGHDRSGSAILDSDLSAYYDISLSEGYVDLVFEAHSHQTYTAKDSKGVFHIQGGGENKGISHVAVKINTANDKGTVLKAEVVSNSVYKQCDDHPIVDDLMEKYADKVAIASKALGKNDKIRNSNEICQTVADLYYQAGLEKWGEEYDIVLGGAYLKTRAPYDLPAGNLIYGDLIGVLPFDNEIVLCSISGRDLESRFFSLPSNYYISYGDYGAGLQNKIDYNKTYYIVTDRYTSLYSWNNLTEIDFYDTTTYARDLLADYIEAGNWTKPAVMSDIPTLLQIGAGLGDNEETSTVYYVKGKIVEINSPEKYGNMTIEDENGNQLYVYGTWDESGANRYGNMANKPQVGDTVVLCGAIKKYVYNGNVTIEMMNGRFCTL